MNEVTMYQLDEVMPDPEDNGIFNVLAILYEVPWKNNVDASVLDPDYLYNHSGCKYGSPIVQRMARHNEGSLTTGNIISLASIAWARYGRNWSKLWATLNLEYNPIENYSMTEHEEGSTGEDTSDDLTHGEVITAGGSDTVRTDVYAYDSATPTPSEQVISTPGSTSTHSGTDGREISKTGTHERDMTRSGNIGVTTSQQMIASERELWMWDFFAVVYNDIDKLLSIPIY